jgi:hypothetical protein
MIYVAKECFIYECPVSIATYTHTFTLSFQQYNLFLFFFYFLFFTIALQTVVHIQVNDIYYM